GRGGNDHIIGGHGYAHLSGGAGDDIIEGRPVDPGGSHPEGFHFYAGEAGRDRLTGTDERDVLEGDFYKVFSPSDPAFITMLELNADIWLYAEWEHGPDGRANLHYPHPAQIDEPVHAWWGEVALGEPAYVPLTLDRYLDLVLGVPDEEEAEGWFDDVI